MDHLTPERYYNHPGLRAEMKAAAQRERARVLTRFLEQAAQALLGNRPDAERARIVRQAQPCEAC